MNHSLHHRDIAGHALNPGDHCLVTEHNRLILAKVVKCYQPQMEYSYSHLIALQVAVDQSPIKSSYAESATMYIELRTLRLP